MTEVLVQAISKRQLIKKQRKFLNGKIAKTYNPKVASSGYDSKSKMYFVKYNYDTTK